MIGAHISEGVKLPSGENISEIMTTIDHKKLLGIMLSCVSPENYEKNLDEIKSLGVPFGLNSMDLLQQNQLQVTQILLTKVKQETRMNFWVTEKI